MASTGRQSPEALDDDTRWRTAGDRIQLLLDASAGSGTVVRERTEQLAGELTDLYGAALERMVSIAAESAPELVGAFAADELVASLMLVHGLHPHGVERRIEDALDGVRPYLGSHGGDVTLLEVVDDVVRLRFAGSCKSCPSSAVTLEFAVEDAVRAAAPEITSIEVVAAEPDSAAAAVISADSLMTRIRTKDTASAAAWYPVPDIGELGSGEVGGFLVAGVPILACRVGDDLFAYHDRCGRCDDSMAGALLHRPMGAPIGQAVLRCPRCHAHFDAVHAGAGLDDNAAQAPHLDPIPLLLRDGVLSVAVLAESTGVM
jgi:Fe-S cluster biogenesis protein NfuA/nitrite reductase/ring-hydroxylating ferredoxin subunit